MNELDKVIKRHLSLLSLSTKVALSVRMYSFGIKTLFDCL